MRAKFKMWKLFQSCYEDHLHMSDDLQLLSSGCSSLPFSGAPKQSCKMFKIVQSQKHVLIHNPIQNNPEMSQNRNRSYPIWYVWFTRYKKVEPRAHFDFNHSLTLNGFRLVRSIMTTQKWSSTIPSLPRREPSGFFFPPFLIKPKSEKSLLKWALGWWW